MSNFSDFLSGWTEGTHYEVTHEVDSRKILSIAIHGGGIEVGTTEAQSLFVELTGASWYNFDAKLPSGNSDLHLTSTLYDDPLAVSMVKNSLRCVSWHGAANDPDGLPKVFVGGLDHKFRDSVIRHMTLSGFHAEIASINHPELAGENQNNIANLGRHGGVQLEMTTAMRQQFFVGEDWSRAARSNPDNWTPAMYDFVNAVVSAYNEVTYTPIMLPDSVTVTNLFTNPEGERTSGEVVVWENYCTDSTGNTWNRNNTGRNTYTLNDPFPVPHPWGATHGTAHHRVPNSTAVQLYSVASYYDTKVSPPSGIKGDLFWMYANFRGYIDAIGSAPVIYFDANEWTLIDRSEALRSGSMGLGISTAGRNATNDDRVWIAYYTGVDSDNKVPTIPFSDDYSPDPDLTAQARPGGGAQLVGQAVAGYTLTNGVCVQSSQWTKDGSVSARLIRNVDTGNTYMTRVSSGSVESALVHRRQESEITLSGTAAAIGTMYAVTPTVYSNKAPNEQGETLLSFFRGAATGTNLVLYGGQGVGESIWFDLLTATEIPNYDGPPFSGDTEPFEYMGQTVYPRWDGEPHNSTSSFDYYESPGPWSPTITWNSAIQRAYHLGVSRGVLELDGVIYPWSGLTSAEISPDSEAPVRRYLDGVVYDVRIPPTNHQGKVSAFTYPLEFEEYIGNPNVDSSGLRAHGQQYKPFNMAFRTEVGTAMGVEHYKLHFVYGAYAIPSALSYDTINSSPEGATFDFDILTTAQKISGFRPTAYFTIDTREENPMLIESIENALYGFEGSDPWFPTVEQLRAALDR